VVDSLGRTVIATTLIDAQNHSHVDVLRLTPQGTLDTTFGSGGLVEVDVSAVLGSEDVFERVVAIATGDKVVALGWTHDNSGNDFTALVRLGRGYTQRR
jgi:hypothetical protein